MVPALMNNNAPTNELLVRAYLALPLGLESARQAVPGHCSQDLSTSVGRSLGQWSTRRFSEAYSTDSSLIPAGAWLFADRIARMREIFANTPQTSHKAIWIPDKIGSTKIRARRWEL
jgi:hypothetical protein